MTHQTPATTSFNGGELSPLMVGRTDTSIYAIAVETMENFVPAIEGPIQKCPGFLRVRPAAADASWMFDFVFNTTQAYVAECRDAAIRLYTNGARIEDDNGDPIEVAMPFATAEWKAVSMQQSYDRRYMAHRLHAPGALSRTGATSFSYAALALKNGPFKDGNSDESVTVTISGALTEGGTCTVTASDNIFQTGHSGALFQVEAKDFSDVEAWQVGLDGIEVGDKRRYAGRVYQALTAGRTGTVEPTHDEGAAWDGDATGKDVNDNGPFGVKWQYLYDRFGIVRLGTIAADGATAPATVIRRIPDSVGSVATWRWAHGAFSDAEGWPNLVFVWAGRLCFWKDFDLFGSVSGDYLNHQAYSSAGYLESDLAFRLTLAAPDPPLWVSVDRDMIVGTASGEWAIGQANSQAGVSGTNLIARRQSSYGSAPVWPEQPGASIIYIERGGRQFREAEYDFARDRYLSANINRWARHIAGPGIIQLGHQQQTEELLFGVRGDGVLVFRSFDPEQQVKGFARRELAADKSGAAGKVLSATCIPSPDGSTDEIWALCEWDGVKSVQKMMPWWKPGDSTLAEAFFVDDGLTDTLEAPSATVSGLEHLAGCTVSILADGGVCPEQVVPESGIITLPYAATTRTVGRGYIARCKTLRAEVRDPTGQTAQGKKKRLVNVIMRLLETSGIKLDAGDGLVNLLDRPTSARMDNPIPLFTGDTDGKSVAGGWDRAAQYEIVSDDPRPCFVIGALPRIEVSDR